MSKSAAAAAPDAVKADPKHYKVEFENNKVRIIRIAYGPNEKSVMHSHRPGVIVSITDQHVRFHLPDGANEDIQFKAGQADWMEATTHLPENLAQQIEVVFIELK